MLQTSVHFPLKYLNMHIFEFIICLQFFWKISFILIMPSFSSYLLCPVSMLLKLWFDSYTNHLGTSVKRKILIQHCGAAPEIPHSHQVPRRHQRCWPAACTFLSKALSKCLASQVLERILKAHGLHRQPAWDSPPPLTSHMTLGKLT